MRRQTAKDDRARRRRTGGTPSRAQGVRQRAGGAFPRRRRRSPTGLPFLLRQAIPGLRRACSSLACAAYFPYASALAPALARLSQRVSLVSRRNPSGDRPPAAALECNRICETEYLVYEADRDTVSDLIFPSWLSGTSFLFFMDDCPSNRAPSDMESFAAQISPPTRAVPFTSTLSISASAVFEGQSSMKDSKEVQESQEGKIKSLTVSRSAS